MNKVLKISIKAILISIFAATIGIAYNHLSPTQLPLIRKPLAQTRSFVKHSDINPSIQNTRIKKTEKPKIEEQKQDTDITAITTKNDQLKNTKATDITNSPIKNIKQQRIKKPVNIQQEKKEPKAQALFISIEEAKNLFDNKTALFIDSRAKIDFDNEHINGAVSLFVYDFDKLFSNTMANIPKSRIIITYCSDPECENAAKLADALVAKGYKNTFIFLEGIPGWKEAGYPTSKHDGKLNE